MKIITPIVRVRGWRTGGVSASLQQVIAGILADAVDFDAEQTAKTIRRLSEGRTVRVEFDTGENDAARAFMRRLEAVGLASTLQEKSIKVPMYHGGFEFFGYLVVRFVLPAILIMIIAEPWTGWVFMAIAIGAVLAAVVIHFMIKRSNRSLELLERFDDDTRAG